MAAFVDRTVRDLERRSRERVALGVVLALAAMTRNEAIWLALTFAIIEWANVRQAFSRRSDRLGAWRHQRHPGRPRRHPDLRAVGVSRLAGLRQPVPRPGADECAQPRRARHLRVAGPADPVALPRRRASRRCWSCAGPDFLHNVLNVLLLLGVPLSVVGLVGLPAAWRGGIWGAGVNPLRPLIALLVLTFAVATLVFPVSTTWGTFLHAAGAIHVLLVVSALLVLDALIGWVGKRRGWTNPVAWLGPAFAIAGCLLFSVVLLHVRWPGRARDRGALRGARRGARGRRRGRRARPTSQARSSRTSRSGSPRRPATTTLALPNEPVESVLSLAGAVRPAGAPPRRRRPQRRHLARGDPLRRPGQRVLRAADAARDPRPPGRPRRRPGVPHPLPVARRKQSRGSPLLARWRHSCEAASRRDRTRRGPDRPGRFGAGGEGIAPRPATSQGSRRPKTSGYRATRCTVAAVSRERPRRCAARASGPQRCATSCARARPALRAARPTGRADVADRVPAFDHDREVSLRRRRARRRWNARALRARRQLELRLEASGSAEAGCTSSCIGEVTRVGDIVSAISAEVERRPERQAPLAIRSRASSVDRGRAAFDPTDHHPAEAGPAPRVDLLAPPAPGDSRIVAATLARRCRPPRSRLRRRGFPRADGSIRPAVARPRRR